MTNQNIILFFNELDNHPTINQSIQPAINQSIQPSSYQSIHPSIQLSINPTIQLSINPTSQQLSWPHPISIKKNQ